MVCPFCKAPAQWVENKAIYGRNYGRSYMVWLCVPCDAYVGCHNNTRNPLGTMANAETRQWRQKAHAVFDPVWKTGFLKRKKAYDLLSKKLGYEVHIGESSIEQCKTIINACTDVFIF